MESCEHMIICGLCKKEFLEWKQVRRHELLQHNNVNSSLRDDRLQEKKNVSVSKVKKSSAVKHAVKHAVKSTPQNTPQNIKNYGAKVLEIIDNNNTATITAISKKIGVSKRTIEYIVTYMKKVGILVREGNDKEGLWKRAT